jgi:hypothetical protein
VNADEESSCACGTQAGPPRREAVTFAIEDAMRALIKWKTTAEGGRKTLPLGTGTPPYAPQVRFVDSADPWPPPNVWSLVVEKVSETSNPFEWLAEVRYLVESAPHHELRSGRCFDLYEGPKCVASGQLDPGFEVVDRNTFFRLINALFRKVLDRLALQSDERCGKMLQMIVSDTNDLIYHGEAGIACENMVENLYEVDVPLTKELLRDIHILCDMMRLTPAALPHLETLVVDG